MFTRKLGRSQREISALGMGCWAIGGPWTMIDHPAGWGQIDDDESERAIQRALDLGVNFFDTAANYGCGHSERILGKALGRKHDSVVIATKFGYQVDEAKKLVTPYTDSPANHLKQDCEDSLRRLNTDIIDLYQFHVGGYDPSRVGDILEILEGLVKDGKIRWYGWSTDNPAGALLFAQAPHCVAIQHILNVVQDAPDILALCDKYDMASVNRSPLGMGLLTGKFTPQTKFPEDDIRSIWRQGEGWRVERFNQMEEVRNLLTSGGRSLAQGALAWIWARNPKTIPIPGFKTVAQVEENIRAVEYGPLGNEQLKELDTLFGR